MKKENKPKYYDEIVRISSFATVALGIFLLSIYCYQGKLTLLNICFAAMGFIVGFLLSRLAIHIIQCAKYALKENKNQLFPLFCLLLFAVLIPELLNYLSELKVEVDPIQTAIFTRTAWLSSLVTIALYL
ncbi:hypothetical protein [Abiotrophia defectiva]|uniref:hypothetical protein n=1 Tax=Abiotrophia defectiva TaxID=46125 RepID=UPI0028E5467D|nr:hypothetical protein [Abiotrophia defectiva]